MSFSILVSSGYMPRSGIAGSYGGFIPSFLRNLHTVFPEKALAAHSSILTWRIPGTEEPGGLPSMGLQSRTRLKRLSGSSSRIFQSDKMQ